MTITEFLLARIAEDEAEARAMMREYERGGDVSSRRWRRVLAECEAKRRIVKSLDLTPCPCQRAERCVIHDATGSSPEFARERYVNPAAEIALRALASVYADHPDFDAAWRLP